MKRKIPLLDKRYPKHRPVSDDEAKLWLESVMDEKSIPPVKPVPKNSVAAAASPGTSPKKKQRAVPQVGALDRVTSAKIRRGALAIDATLDLHGHTRESAFSLLVRFVVQAQERGLRTILVITGKGKGDKDGVLRRLLPLWLNETPLRERIIAYDNASPRHGGSGAWYVRIRKDSGRT